MNNTLKEIRDIIDNICQQKQSEGYRYLMLSIGAVASRHQYTERGIRNAGYPSWFDRRYNACNWKRYKGLHIHIENYIDERREEKHTKKLNNIKQNTTDISTIL